MQDNPHSQDTLVTDLVQVVNRKQHLPGVFRPLTFMLLGFLLAVLMLVEPSRRTYQHVQKELPAVTAPVGQLAQVYENMRPASVQIEARSDLRGYVGAPIGIGTGFFISEDGFILTAYHVVDSSGMSEALKQSLKYVAVSPDKTEYELSLVGFDAYYDLALLKTEVSAPVPFIPLATTQARVRDGIVAIGNSRGDFLAARAGEISRIGVDRPRARFADDTIELTAALAPGDSGGPVLNKYGEAVGVVSFISFAPDAMASETYVAPFLLGQTRGFASYAIPVTVDSQLVADLKAGVRNDIPVIGFSPPSTRSGLPQDYDPRSGLDLGRRAGTIVLDVRPGGPADLAGIKSLEMSRDGEIISADVIVSVNDEPTPTFDSLLESLYKKRVGETVTLTVQRGKQTFKVRVELGAMSQVFN